MIEKFNGIFYLIIFSDLNRCPIFSNNFPPSLDDILGPNILNIKKNITGKKINSVEVLVKVASDNQTQK